MELCDGNMHKISEHVASSTLPTDGLNLHDKC